MKIFQGLEASLVNHYLYQSWDITKPILNYEEIITTAALMYIWFFLVHPICLSHDDLPTYVRSDLNEASLALCQMPHHHILGKELILERPEDEESLGDG